MAIAGNALSTCPPAAMATRPDPLFDQLSDTCASEAVNSSVFPMMAPISGDRPEPAESPQIWEVDWDGDQASPDHEQNDSEYRLSNRHLMFLGDQHLYVARLKLTIPDDRTVEVIFALNNQGNNKAVPEGWADIADSPHEWGEYYTVVEDAIFHPLKQGHLLAHQSGLLVYANNKGFRTYIARRLNEQPWLRSLTVRATNIQSFADIQFSIEGQCDSTSEEPRTHPAENYWKQTTPASLSSPTSPYPHSFPGCAAINTEGLFRHALRSSTRAGRSQLVSSPRRRLS